MDAHSFPAREGADQLARLLDTAPATCVCATLAGVPREHRGCALKVVGSLGAGTGDEAVTERFLLVRS